MEIVKFGKVTIDPEAQNLVNIYDFHFSGEGELYKEGAISAIKWAIEILNKRIDELNS